MFRRRCARTASRTAGADASGRHAPGSRCRPALGERRRRDACRPQLRDDVCQQRDRRWRRYAPTARRLVEQLTCPIGVAAEQQLDGPKQQPWHRQGADPRRLGLDGSQSAPASPPCAQAVAGRASVGLALGWRHGAMPSASRSGRSRAPPAARRLVRDRQHRQPGPLAKLADMGADRPARSPGRGRSSPRPGSGGAAGAACARAIEIRCRWPPDRRLPRSPTMVSSPCGSSFTKLPGAGGLQGLDHRLFRHVVLEQGDIVADRVVEQQHLLRHVAEALPPRGEIELLQIDAIDAHGARGRLVEPDQQVDQRRLADAGRADQRRDRALARSPGRGPAGWAARRRRRTPARTGSIGARTARAGRRRPPWPPRSPAAAGTSDTYWS